MTTMNISLPESMRTYIDEKVTQGGYSTASEYIRQLIREDQKAAARERLELMLIDGINSGPASEMTTEDWELLQSRIEQRKAECVDQ